MPDSPAFEAMQLALVKACFAVSPAFEAMQLALVKACFAVATGH